MEDGGAKQRLRCPACGWTHWNNPTPVLAAVIECADRDGQILLARNAAWPAQDVRADHRLHGSRRDARRTASRARSRKRPRSQVDALNLIGVYDFQRMNQVIIAYHAVARGEVGCRPNWSTTGCSTPADGAAAGRPAPATRWPTGCARRGHEPQFIEMAAARLQPRIDSDMKDTA